MTKTNGLPAHLRALELFKTQATVTPAELDKFVGAGAYASKYVCYLKNDGHEITVNKQGRTVVSYTYVSEGDSASRSNKWVAPAKRGAAPAARKQKATVVKTAKPVKVRQSKQTAPASKAARNVLQERADKEADAILAQLGLKDAGEISHGSYSVDPDWDSMDGIDVANFLK